MLFCSSVAAIRCADLAFFDSDSELRSTKNSGNYGATVTIRLDSTVRKFAALGVDQKFLFAVEEDAKQSDSASEGDQDSKLFVIMEFQLSKDVATKAWMVDSVYFVPLEAMRA